MNILLVHPKYPDTYWSFKHALKFVSKKVANLPLGIITVASLLPDEWNKKFADITETPIPDYSLLKLNKYASAGIQYSRGYPFDCEFCDITALFGRRVRTKTSAQVISELDMLLKIGCKGGVVKRIPENYS